MALGELEHLILLQILRLDEDAYALEIRAGLEADGGRSITRGALYRSLDRLADKGLIRWVNVEPGPDRGGHARRRFTVTQDGVDTVATRRETLLKLWDGLETVLQK